MKKFFVKTFFISFYTFSIVTCSQNFFPVNLGNAFQYFGEYDSHGPGGGGSGYTRYRFFLSRDTIIDGKTYYRFGGDQILFSTIFGSYSPLFFYDKNAQKLYIRFESDSLDKVAANFNQSGYYISYLSGQPLEYYSEGVTVDTVWNQVVKSYKMKYTSAYSIKEFRFADGLGLYYESRWSNPAPTLWSSGFDNLVAAIIDSVEYNNNYFVNFINLSPLTDRPQDAFPFILTATISAMVPALIDSFYVEIWHVRNDTVKRYFKIDFSNNQANVPILPSWLKVEDLIKIRAKISEASIFRNTDYFPEEGFAYIKVLPPVTNVVENKLDLTFSLEQNYPNPFNPSTKISWQVPVSSWQTLRVYDVLGNEVATLVDEYREAGKYEVEFDSEKLSSGIYLYKLQAGNFIDTKKMILMR